MKDAVIVSTARTPIGKAFRGAFNNTKTPTMTAVAIKAAVARAGIDGAEIDDVVMGCGMQAASAAGNIARTAALAAGVPVTVSANTIDRQCSSGLAAIAAGARQIMVDGMSVVLAGGTEQISLIQNDYIKTAATGVDPNVLAQAEHAYNANVGHG